MSLAFTVRTGSGGVGNQLDPRLLSGVTLIERDGLPSSLQITGTPEEMNQCFFAGGVEDYTRGVFVDDGDTTRMSGTLTEVLIAANEVTCTWDSDTLLLWERLVYPNPAQAWQSQTAAYWTAASAPAETVMLAAISANAGPSAPLTYRRNTITVPTSAGRGPSRSAQLRFDNLGRWVADTAESTGLRVSVVQDQGASQPAVRVRACVNRTTVTAPAVPAVYGSSRTGGAIRVVDDSWEVRIAAPAVTASLVAGTGDLAARKLRERSDADAATRWGRRIEVLNDQSGTDSLTELDQAGDDALSEGASPVEISGVSIENYPGLVLGTDLLLGDVVGVDLYPGVSITDRLRQIKTEIRDGVPSVTGVVGSPEAGLTRTQKDYLKQARALRRAAT